MLAVPVLAGQRSGQPNSDALPGVERNYSIVTPAPEPLEPQAAASGYTFRTGNTDIRISGSVSVEIGTGPSRHGGQQRR
jgi:hypothetical protein